jgi:hypothetical protein
MYICMYIIAIYIYICIYIYIMYIFNMLHTQSFTQSIVVCTPMAEEFRTFPMEHLAGEESTVVRLKEHQCLFEWLDVDLRARGGSYRDR